MTDNAPVLDLFTGLPFENEGPMYRDWGTATEDWSTAPTPSENARQRNMEGE